MSKNSMNEPGCATSRPLLLVHGGAGDISDARVPGKLLGVKVALRAAMPHLVLNSTESNNALAAVEAAVRSMELDKNFNAGYGACLNTEGNVEVEASIMEGKELQAGCVTLLHDIMHPISVARTVMERSNHTFIGGPSAQKFALDHGFAQLPLGSLVTEDAQLALQEFLEQRAAGKCTLYARTELDSSACDPSGETVGAVAIDCAGNIAAATSTGGITGKVPGRIGDSPLLGCGTYAENAIGGVSTTGHGETIMRYNLAQRILARIRHSQESAQHATERACVEMTDRLSGTGGAITVDGNGQPGIHWTSRRMAWAYVLDGTIHYGIDHGEAFEEPL